MPKAKIIIVLSAFLIVSAAGYLIFRPGAPMKNEITGIPADNHTRDMDTRPPTENLIILGSFKVARVVDGDTFILENGETVRLTGIDTPELHHPELPVQRFAVEAGEFLKGMVEGLDVILKTEPGNERDAYGRLLAYAFIDDLFVNKELVRRGYAYTYLRFPFRYSDEFLLAQKEAIEKQYGLWNLSLTDGGLTNLVNKFNNLDSDGRKVFMSIIDSLLNKHSLIK